MVFGYFSGFGNTGFLLTAKITRIKLAGIIGWKTMPVYKKWQFVRVAFKIVR